MLLPLTRLQKVSATLWFGRLQCLTLAKGCFDSFYRPAFGTVRAFIPVMCPSHFCRFRVTSPSSQSHLNFFRVESESWLGRVESESSEFFSSRIRVMTWSSRVRVKSQELSSHFESLVCKLESMPSHTKFHVFLQHFFGMKWRLISSKMVPNMLWNGAR